MSIRELDILSRSLKGTDCTVIRADFSLYQKDLTREGVKFLKEVQSIAKKEKQGTVILVGIVRD